MTQYKIHPIVVGSKVFDKTMMTYQHGYGQQYTVPVYCWYLEGGDKKVLVDTGEMSPLQSEEREKAINGKIFTFEEGLMRWSLTPNDIDLVIHTHLHKDHCENDAKCVNATFFVHQKELERIHNPHPLDYRYAEEYIMDVEENGQIATVLDDCEILPGINVMHTPAHTGGGLTVLVDTAQGKAAITGFCATLENFNPPKEIAALDMEVIPPGTHVNVYDAYDLMVKIKNLADVLLPLHEPRFASEHTVA